MNWRSRYSLKIASRNILRHWRRSLAAILSVAAGFIALNLFEGYIADTELLFDVTYSQRLMYGDILIQKEGAFQNGIWDDGTFQISPEEQTKLSELLNSTGIVDNSVRFLNLNGLVTNGRTTAVFAGYGYDVEAGRQMRLPRWEWNTLAGRPLSPEPDDGIIGQGLGKLLDCVPARKLGTQQMKGGYAPVDREMKCAQRSLQMMVSSNLGQVNAITVNVRGILDAIYTESDVRFIAVSLEQAQALAGTKDISFLSVRLKSRDDDVASAVDLLNERFRSSGLPLVAIRWQDHPYGDIYVRSLSFLNVFRYFTLAVVLAIVTLSVVSTLVRLVQERTREIGTLRSIGFRNNHVLVLFLIEGVLLTVLGITVGIIGSIVIAHLVEWIGIYYKIGILAEDVPLNILLPASHFVSSAAVLLIIALGATYVATRRALKAKIPDCLAHN